MEQAPLILVVHDGRPARVHYALTLAATAAALSRPVSIFVAGDAVVCFTANWRDVDFDQTCEKAGVATVQKLLVSLAEMKRANSQPASGLELFICEQALRLAHLEETDLDRLLEPRVVGSMTLLQMMAPPASCLFI